MKRLLVILALVGWTSPAWAAICPEGLVVKKLGTPGNRTESMYTPGADVYAVGWQCTGSACTFGLYDGADTISTNANVAEGQVQFEAGGVASGGGFISFANNLGGPIYFPNGIGMVTGGNVAGAIAYGCVQR